MDFLENTLHLFVNFAMLLFEYIGVIVITFAGIQGIVNYVRKNPETRLVLAQGLAMGLEFKLGSEILRTVVVRSLNEIAIVGSIIALRAVLTILIHWEIKNEVNEKKPELSDPAEAAAVVPEAFPSEDTAARTVPAASEAADAAETGDSASNSVL